MIFLMRGDGFWIKTMPRINDPPEFAVAKKTHHEAYCKHAMTSVSWDSKHNGLTSEIAEQWLPNNFLPFTWHGEDQITTVHCHEHAPCTAALLHRWRPQKQDDYARSWMVIHRDLGRESLCEFGKSTLTVSTMERINIAGFFPGFAKKQCKWPNYCTNGSISGDIAVTYGSWSLNCINL